MPGRQFVQKKMLKEMEAVLKYNRKHLLKNFTLATIQNLYNEV